MGASKREQLIEAALGLFDRGGYHATGIDAILREAGVAKMTLYNHFRSKDELILAALRLRDERHRNWMMREIESASDDPVERLVAVFAVARRWYCRRDFHGCAFVSAAREFPDPEHPVHVAAIEHVRLFKAFLRGLAEDAGAADPTELAEELMLLLSGATTAAQMSCCDASAAVAERAARRLVEAAVGAPSGG
jgi:AcrR family transcriptional regulator